MRNWFVGIAFGLAILAGGTSEARADVIEIKVSDNVFTPDFVVIYLDDTVHWVWDEGIHTVTSLDGFWDSGLLGPGGVFDVTFEGSGQFDYSCTIHLDCCNMVGTVYVLPFPRPT